MEVRVLRGPLEVLPELPEDFDAWARASAEALKLAERRASAVADDATR